MNHKLKVLIGAIFLSLAIHVNANAQLLSLNSLERICLNGQERAPEGFKLLPADAVEETNFVSKEYDMKSKEYKEELVVNDEFDAPRNVDYILLSQASFNKLKKEMLLAGYKYKSTTTKDDLTIEMYGNTRFMIMLITDIKAAGKKYKINIRKY